MFKHLLGVPFRMMPMPLQRPSCKGVIDTRDMNMVIDMPLRSDELWPWILIIIGGQIGC